MAGTIDDVLQENERLVEDAGRWAEASVVAEGKVARLEREVAELREALERFAKEWRFLIQIGQLDDHGELAQAEAALKGHAQGTE